MFLDAIESGLRTLLYWQTYVAVLLFILLSVGPMVLFGLATASAGRASGAVGCLLMLVTPLFQTFALVVFVLTLAPLMLGFSSDAAWTLAWEFMAAEPWVMARLVGQLLIAALILAFIPILGRMQSLHTLLLGSLALALIIGFIEHSNPGHSISMWPGFWFVVGLLIVGSALAWVGTIIAAIVATAIEAKVEGLGQLIAFPIAATLGFVPLFIYAGWLGAQVRSV